MEEERGVVGGEEGEEGEIRGGDLFDEGSSCSVLLR